MYELVFKGTLRGKQFCVTFTMPGRFIKDYSPNEFLADTAEYVFYNLSLWNTICHAVGNSIYTYFMESDEITLTLQKETSPKSPKCINLDITHVNNILSRVYIFDRTAL